MKEDMENLLKLQKIDAMIAEMESSKDNFPRDIEETENLMIDKKAQVEHARGKIEDIEKQKKALEHEIKTEEERIKKDKGRLMQVKNNNEYHALLREIDNSRREISDKETQVLRLLEEAEAEKAAVSEIESGLKNLEDEIKSKKEKFESLLKDADENIEEKKKDREEYVNKINPSLLKKYNMIKDKKEYSNILTKVQGNSCATCNMNIPPQMVNEVRAMSHIHICPTCERILYWSDKDEKNN